MSVSNLVLTDTFDAVATTTLRNYMKTLEDNAFQDIPLYYWLKQKKRTKRKGGRSLVVPLIYGHNNTVKHYKGYELLDVTPQEGITAANFKWHQISVSVSIDGESETLNSGDEQLIDLLQAKFMQAEKSLSYDINENLHGRFGSKEKTYGTEVLLGSGKDSWGGTDVSTEGFNSLDNIVRMYPGFMDVMTTGARTHKLGEIEVSITTDGGGGTIDDFQDAVVTAQQNSWWMNYSNPGFLKYAPQRAELGAANSALERGWAGDIDDISNFDLTSVMRAMYNRVTEGTDKPDLGLTSFEIYELYEASLVPQERFTSTETGDAGFDNLRYKKMTVMPDHGIRNALPTTVSASAPPVPFYFLNSNYLEWCVHRKRDFITTGFMRPHNQDARTAQILAMAQLTCSNRQRQGVISCATAEDYYTA